jgi:hypothetical protein
VNYALHLLPCETSIDYIVNDQYALSPVGEFLKLGYPHSAGKVGFNLVLHVNLALRN